MAPRHPLMHILFLFATVVATLSHPYSQASAASGTFYNAHIAAVADHDEHPTLTETIETAPRTPPWMHQPSSPLAVAPWFQQSEQQTGRALDIMGGEEAQPGAWPWQAALVRAEMADAYAGQFCGGSLIAPLWVLTAAHCVQNAQPTFIHVVLGRHQLSSAEGERIPVAQIIVHQDFDYYNLDSDLALVRLARPSTQQPIGLDAPDDAILEQQGTPATVIGWGIADPAYQPSDVLRQVVLPVVQSQTCKSMQQYAGWIKPSMICAGFTPEVSSSKSPCYGDSGGPLMVRRPEDNGWAQIGVVSWGFGCQGYGVFGRVSIFKTWIQRCMADPTSDLCRGVDYFGDAYEPNNHPQPDEKFKLTPTVEQRHNSHRLGDDDWLQFSAVAGRTYIIETLKLAKGADTGLWLYDTDGFTVLQWNNDVGYSANLSYEEFLAEIQAGRASTWLASRIVWTAPSDGLYFVQVMQQNLFATGPRSRYNVRLIELTPQTYLPLMSYSR